MTEQEAEAVCDIFLNIGFDVEVIDEGKDPKYGVPERHWGVVFWGPVDALMALKPD